MLQYVNGKWSVQMVKPRQATIAVNHQYDIIRNIAGKDGLMNGAQCCIKYVQPQKKFYIFHEWYGSNLKKKNIGAEQCKKYTSLFKQEPNKQKMDTNICRRRTFAVKSVWITHV